MNSAMKLAAIGCGEEMVRCQMERSNIHATISNTKQFFKYYEYALKAGLYPPDVIEQKLIGLLNDMKRVEFIAEKFKDLYGEKFYSLKLLIEKKLTNAKTIKP